MELRFAENNQKKCSAASMVLGRSNNSDMEVVCECRQIGHESIPQLYLLSA